MIQGGYYIKARKIQDSAIATAPPHVREIWDWLLKEANHKDSGSLKRGQTVRSIKDIQEGLRWYVGYRREVYPKHRCEMALKWLRNAGMILTTKTTRGMVITVCNYDIYQDPKNYESNKNDGTKATRKQQRCDTINKNVKNYKEIKNGNISSEFDEVFVEWFSYKDERKEKLTTVGIEKQISKVLKDYPEVGAFREAVDFSISNNYRGLISPNNKKTTTVNKESSFD